MDRGFYTKSYEDAFYFPTEVTWLAATSVTKPTEIRWLYTTGAVDRNSSLNIYDFNGNLWEWTLERKGSSGNECVRRGGHYNNGSGAAYRYGITCNVAISTHTSRVALYLK